jgi:hypothetical protein
MNADRVWLLRNCTSPLKAGALYEDALCLLDTLPHLGYFRICQMQPIHFSVNMHLFGCL